MYRHILHPQTLMFDYEKNRIYLFWLICYHPPVYIREARSQLLVWSYPVRPFRFFSRHILLLDTLHWVWPVRRCLHLPASPIADNASLIKEWTDARSSRRYSPLPKWNFAQFKGETLQWNEWYGHFKSAIDCRPSLKALNWPTLKRWLLIKQLMQSFA